MHLGEVEFIGSNLQLISVTEDSAEAMGVVICSGCGSLVADSFECRGKHQRDHHPKVSV